MANFISGQSIAGSTLTLSGAASATTTAGPTGAYKFSSLSNGAYTITPSKIGYKFFPVNSPQTISGSDITGVNFLGQPVGTLGSTYTIQNEIDKVKGMPELETTFNVGGFSREAALTAANDVFNEICAVRFPHKWNSAELPLFYTWSWQQDYALINPDGSSLYSFEWLEKGVAINISSNQQPKPWVRVECGRALPRRTGTFVVNGGTMMGDPGFLIQSLPNAQLYYGTWGAPDTNSSSWGNNPKPGSFYMGPVGIFVITATWSAASGGQATFTLNQLPSGAAAGQTLQISGATPTGFNGNWTIVTVPGSAVVNPQVVVTMVNNPGTFQTGGIIQGTGSSMPANPISQIIDANGNLLLITTYGTEGTAAPLAAIGAFPGTQVSGTGASTIWTVVDPVGMGIRILNVPSQTGVVWQFTIDGQLVPPKFTALTQVLAPLPDKYEPFFRDGFVAQMYKFSKDAKARQKFPQVWELWKQSLKKMNEAQDRELEEWSFLPERTVMGSGRSRNTFRGAAWPFPYPIVN